MRLVCDSSSALKIEFKMASLGKDNDGGGRGGERVGGGRGGGGRGGEEREEEERE